MESVKCKTCGRQYNKTASLPSILYYKLWLRSKKQICPSCWAIYLKSNPKLISLNKIK